MGFLQIQSHILTSFGRLVNQRKLYLIMVAITLNCQVCSTRYQAVLIKKVFENQLHNQNNQYEKYVRFSITQRNHHVQPPS